jgi:hypothetical protein
MESDKKNPRTAGGEDGETAEIGETKTLETGHNDIGYALYQEALQIDPVVREKIAKTVKLKLDFILLPLVRYTALSTW